MYIYDVVSLVRAFNKIFDEIKISANNEENFKISTLAVLNFVTSLENEIDYHFSEIYTIPFFQLATFLDPKYKGKFFNNFLIEDIKQKLLTAKETKYRCSLEEPIADMLNSGYN